MGLKIGYPKSDGFKTPKVKISQEYPNGKKPMKNPCGSSYHPAVRYIIQYIQFHPISSNNRYTHELGDIV